MLKKFKPLHRRRFQFGFLWGLFYQDKAAVDVARVTITLATTAARVTPATREATVRLKSTIAQVRVVCCCHWHVS